MLESSTKIALSKRLKLVSGQLNGIDKMIGENASCTDVLIQLNAAKSALHKVGQIVLEEHINHCVRESIERDVSELDMVLSELAQAIEQFSRMG